MMSRFLLSVVMLLTAVVVGAQDNRERTISGTVHDADLKEPMVQALLIV